MKSYFLFLCLSLCLNTFANSDYTIREGRYGTQYVQIQGLEQDLFQKYVVKNSRGPKWGQDADFISDVVNEDFWERHTYWNESGYPEQECPDFSREDFDDSIEAGYGLSWQAVKKKSGSSKTVFYLAQYTITIEAPTKSCTYVQSGDSYVFLNKVIDGKPTYLGYLE